MDNSRFLNWLKPLKPLPFYEEVIRQDAAYYRSLGFNRQTSFGVWLEKTMRLLSASRRLLLMRTRLGRRSSPVMKRAKEIKPVE